MCLHVSELECVCVWVCLWEPNAPRHVAIRFPPVDGAIPFGPQRARLVPPSGPRHLLSPTVHKTQQMECIHKNTINLVTFLIHIEVLSHFALGHGKMTLMHSLSGILF